MNETEQSTYLHDGDVIFSVFLLVRAVNTVVLQPFNVRLQAAQSSAFEHRCLPDLHRRIVRSLVDDRHVTRHSYRTVYYVCTLSNLFDKHNIRLESVGLRGAY